LASPQLRRRHGITTQPTIAHVITITTIRITTAITAIVHTHTTVIDTTDPIGATTTGTGEAQPIQASSDCLRGAGVADESKTFAGLTLLAIKKRTDEIAMAGHDKRHPERLTPDRSSLPTIKLDGAAAGPRFHHPSPLFSGESRRHELRPSCFALVVGNARSGTTIVGSIIDAHPQMICANETTGSSHRWEGMTGAEIVAEIVENSERQYAAGRESSNYRYRIETDPKLFRDILVIADKIWNPTLLLLHGDHGLLGRIEQSVGAPVSIVHCVRNPLDAIATMHRRSGASLHNRARWYFMHCEAAQALMERRDRPMYTIYHEDILLDPDQEIHNLYEFFGLTTPSVTFRRIKSILFAEQKKTYLSVRWPRAVIGHISTYAGRFEFLRRYTIPPEDAQFSD
jgi:hypothetical protein